MRQLWALLALAGPFILAAGLSSPVYDTWWSLKLGQVSVQAGRPVVDVVLAHAPTAPTAANGQWLSQAALYLLYTAFGEVGLRLTAGLALGLSLAAVLAAARIGGAGPRAAAAATLLAAVLAIENVGVRAQLLAYPLFGLTLLLLELRRTRPRLLWLLPPIFALWANVHGSFPLGLLLVGVYACGGRWTVDNRPSSIVLVLAASALATFLNPLGPGLYGYVLAVTTNPSIKDLVSEWQPTTIQGLTGQALALSGVLLFAAMKTSRRPIAAREALLLLAFGYLALSSMRHVVWLGLVLAPILARHLAASRLLPSSAEAAPSRPASSPLNLVVAGLVLLLAVLAPFWRPAEVDDLQRSKAASVYAPVAAAEFLAGLPEGGKLLHFQPWTGYLAWRLWPAQQPMVDGRIEAHPPAVWADYMAASLGRVDWEAVADRYAVDYLVLHAERQARLVSAAEATGRWARLYADETAVVLGRLR